MRNELHRMILDTRNDKYDFRTINENNRYRQDSNVVRSEFWPWYLSNVRFSRSMVERYYSEEWKESMSFRLWYLASDETWNIFNDGKRY